MRRGGKGKGEGGKVKGKAMRWRANVFSYFWRDFSVPSRLDKFTALGQLENQFDLLFKRKLSQSPPLVFFRFQDPVDIGVVLHTNGSK